MKTRRIFTVIREYDESNAKAAQESFGPLHDEAGEFLYGGSADKETIQVELQVKIGNRWSTIARTEPQ